jgi:F420-non-reducing hydrogenase iron-sulfur subunit
MKMPEKRVRTKAGRFCPKILVFACNWCSYAAADLAGISRLDVLPDFMTIRVMCSARVRPEFVMYAFSRGFDGVFILGCHPGECHYSEGNLYTRRRVLLLKETLEFFGVEPERLQLRWVSASEGNKFAGAMNKMIESVRALGPQNIEI